MTEPYTNIEELQASRAMDSQQMNRMNAVRQALGVLAPRQDDGQQSYPELLRRLRDAIDVELATAR